MPLLSCDGMQSGDCALRWPFGYAGAAEVASTVTDCCLTAKAEVKLSRLKVCLSTCGAHQRNYIAPRTENHTATSHTLALLDFALPYTTRTLDLAL